MIKHLYAVTMVASVLSFGCASSRSGDQMQATTSLSSSRVTVPVELDDYVIRMPATIPPGDVTFAVKNVGDHSHNVRVRGQNVDAALPKNLKGGESGTLEAHLEPGTYRVTCPVGPHAMMGMRTTLTVKK